MTSSSPVSPGLVSTAVLSWFKSYLSYRCFRDLRDKCETDLSSWYTSPCGVPPRLCPWITTLRHVHHSSEYPHFLVPEAITSTQMTLSSFFPPSRLRLSIEIDHLHNAVDQISSWMTANLLTLNSPETEFLLIGLSKQLANVNNSSINTTHSARNLGFIFDEHLTFSDQISCLQILLLPYPSASLHPSIPRYQNSFHHRHFHCSLQA